MSSLRPLITIMLLAAVGVVLYMKINETEPIVPADVPQWSAEPLQIGGARSGESMGSPTTAAPAFEAEEAPAFTPGAIAGAAATLPGGDAPAWTPEPLAMSEPPKQDAASAAAVEAGAVGDAESSPVARSADAAATVPAMPPLPGSETPPAAVADAPAFTPIETTPLAGASPDAPAAGIVETEPLATAAPAAESAAPTAEDGAAVAAQVDAPGDAAQTASTTPTAEAAPASTDAAAESPAKTSAYSSARVAAQAALDRGELAQALLLLSEWYDDPSLTPGEAEEVNTLLSQLAGSVIYDGTSHRLERAYIVQAGETLDDVAKKYNVPAQLLAKINGVAEGAPLQPGQELKVVRGPFTAVIELGKRKMTLMLDRRYAGKFSIDVDPAASIEDGSWKVEQKELTPAIGGLYGQPPGATQERSLLLTSEADPGKTIIIRGPGSGDPAGIQPPGRTIRLKANDVSDLYDILSEGSRVTVRR